MLSLYPAATPPWHSLTQPETGLILTMLLTMGSSSITHSTESMLAAALPTASSASQAVTADTSTAVSPALTQKMTSTPPSRSVPMARNLDQLEKRLASGAIAPVLAASAPTVSPSVPAAQEAASVFLMEFGGTPTS